MVGRLKTKKRRKWRERKVCEEVKENEVERGRDKERNTRKGGGRDGVRK
jgi:hypothetical protein